MFAKIQNNQVKKYPYLWPDLQSENPSTNFDNRYDLSGWFALTESAAESALVEVVEDERPFITAQQKLSLARLPVLVDEQWKLLWTVSELTPEEIAVNNSLATE